MSDDETKTLAYRRGMAHVWALHGWRVCKRGHMRPHVHRLGTHGGMHGCIKPAGLPPFEVFEHLEVVTCPAHTPSEVGW